MTFNSVRLVVEELRNIWATKLASGGVVAVALMIGVLVPMLGASESQQLVNMNARYLEAGVSTFVVTRSQNLPLSSARCEELNRIAGVVSAGGIESDEVAYLAARPGQPISLVFGSRNATNLIWPNDRNIEGASVVVGSELGRLYGLRSNSLAGIVTQADPHDIDRIVLVDYVAHSTIRTRTADSTIFVVRPSETIRRCLVEASADATHKVADLLSGWWDPINDIVISPLFIDTSRTYSSLSIQLDNRMSRWAAPIAGVALIFMSMGYVISRRWDFATYRQLGLTVKGAIIFALLETGLLILVPVLMGASFWLAFLARVSGGDLPRQLAIFDLAALISVIPLIVPINALVIGRTRPSHVFAER
jgi:hypothetical protein